MTESRPNDPGVADPRNDVAAGRRSLVPILALSAVVALVLAIVAITFAPGVACACEPTSPPSPSSPIDGVIVRIDATNITKVNGFDLRTSDGRTITFVLGQLENPTQFPPGHLAEHQATSSPVRVYFVERDGAATVYRLEDAPPPSS